MIGYIGLIFIGIFIVLIGVRGIIKDPAPAKENISEKIEFDTFQYIDPTTQMPVIRIRVREK